jgi:branched-chain amino acid transport system permease protein
MALIALPFVLASAGTAWVRIMNFAVLFVLLSLGLNIVVGFAGLLDLGYVAFYAVGAYVYALLASPHFGLHLPFWVILPIGAAVACIAGVILGRRPCACAATTWRSSPWVSARSCAFS